MVVLWGLMEDTPLAVAYHGLKQLGVPVSFIDQRQILECTFSFSLSENISGEIIAPGVRLSLDEASVLYFRPYNFESLDVFSDINRNSREWARAAQFEDAMMLWAETFPGLVVNRPSAMSSNSSKPYQLELIRQHGFATPETLITTDPESVLQFWRKHQRIIYKSISSSRSIVSQLSEPDLATLEDVVCCPTQFQRFIDGMDYRVHVIDTKVYACKIVSPHDDYRYSTNTQMEPAILDYELEQRCVRLTRALGLHFSGIDLRQSINGEWYCFEVNPSPGYTCFDQSGAISRALVYFLARAITKGEQGLKLVDIPKLVC